MTQDIFSLCCPTYLIIVTKRTSSGSDQIGVINRKMVLYLTFHFHIRACAIFPCSRYPPPVVEAVKEYPHVMRTVHPLSISLQVLQKRYLVDIVLLVPLGYDGKITNLKAMIGHTRLAR